MTKVRKCAHHPDVEAAYRCSQCRKLLCQTCVKPEEHLVFCKTCGRHAVLLESPAEPFRFREAASQVSGEIRGLSLPVLNHIVLPAAVILMVSAFLFFLLDVRSVFFSESMAIRRVALCFGVATVLIARYGKIYGGRDMTGSVRQTLYTVLLAVVTMLVMLRFSHGMWEFLADILIVTIVWWLATRVTNRLDFGEEDQPKLHSVYGVERLNRERIDSRVLKTKTGAGRTAARTAEQGLVGGLRTSKSLEGPSAAVARLAALALIAFALGEPVLLSGPPEVGKRAIFTVVVFLFAAGIVMSAGSALQVSRRARRAGGQFALGSISSRVAVSFVLLVIILSAALALPGIEYRGSGELTPQTEEWDTGRKGPDRSEQQRTGQRTGPDSQGGPGSLFQFAASLGRWLLLPLILFLGGAFIYAVAKLKPKFRVLSGLREFLRRLRERLRLSRRSPGEGEEAPDTPSWGEIAKTLSGFQSLPPRQSILKAYEALCLFFSLLGHRRPANNTPYEVLRSLPRRFEFLKDPAASLTDLYVAAAYGSSPPTALEARSAEESIKTISGLIREYEKKRT